MRIRGDMQNRLVVAKEEDKMNVSLHRVALLAASAAVVFAVIAPAASAARDAAPARVKGTIHQPFTATVLQGPDRGLALAGTLDLKVWSDGRLSGSLNRKAAAPLAVTGQVHGQLIGLHMNLGKGKNVFGTGTVGYDGYQKKQVIGGTFNGPSDRSTGVWDLASDPIELEGYTMDRVVSLGFTPGGLCIGGIVIDISGPLRPGLKNCVKIV